MPDPAVRPKTQPAVGPAVNDRRAAERYPSDLVTSVHPLALPRKDSVAAMVKDVSEGGISLVIRYGFEPGTVLVIDLDGTTDSGTPPLLGRVVHATQRGDGRWVLGCALRRQLSPEQLRACGATPDGAALVHAAATEEAAE
jgi:hypothetical protein